MKLDTNTLSKYICHNCYAEIDGEITILTPYHFGMHLKQIERGQTFKLCLLPLSALTEPCLEGCKIPIEELYELFGSKSGFAKFFFQDDLLCGIERGIFQYRIAEQLFEWHFWLGDQRLFETGEIIDKRTLNL